MRRGPPAKAPPGRAGPDLRAGRRAQPGPALARDGLVLAVVAVVLVLWLLLGTDAASALASWSLGFG